MSSCHHDSTIFSSHLCRGLATVRENLTGETQSPDGMSTPLRTRYLMEGDIFELSGSVAVANRTVHNRACLKHCVSSQTVGAK